MKRIIVILSIIVIFISCSGKKENNSNQNSGSDKTIDIKVTEKSKQKYFELYRNMLELTHRYKNDHEKLQEEIDNLFEESGMTRKEYDQLGLKLIEKDKEYFKNKISQINEEFSDR
ncbi:MAG: hypothetical protein FXF47_00775 [Candidatus Mcinerneyibacterium aminivorans]|uniref:DUF4296 domain-containing protein n=1 Tax=Candidatus Mcinerneyibacterium aminivorans TaxID=2703815 RepID=A0A5D0MNH6_9BACT|nr:MAG: hypothetical protein FXF47_00775 [Candidatus Mcinerneyibacterium aminivorans]